VVLNTKDNPRLGYKFSDKALFNSEIEFEHASTGKRGSVSVEFAHLDFLLHPAANVRAGMVLVPMGFLNELHEPPWVRCRIVDLADQA
jgi:hypothetical protein